MKDCVRVKVSGLNLSRFINKLLHRGVLIDNLVLKNSHIKFSIKESDLSVLEEVCKQEKKFYSIIGRKGFKQVFGKLPFMLGSFLAIVIVYVFMFSYSLFVFNVDVSAVSDFDLTEVRKVLDKNNIKSGMQKNEISNQEIERLIIKSVPGVYGCSVAYYGGNLKIIIFPATDKQEVESEDIVSLYDAVITECEVFAGSAMVKSGDVVKKGDVLIKNDNGAEGRIKGKVYFSSTLIHNENQQIVKKTGNVFKVNNLKLFNKFTIKNEKTHNFSSYIVEKCDFYICYDYLIPIVCESLIVHETVIENVVIPFEDVEKQILEKLKNEIITNYGKDVDENKLTYSIVKDGAYTRVDCFFEVEIDLF